MAETYTMVYPRAAFRAMAAAVPTTGMIDRIGEPISTATKAPALVTKLVTTADPMNFAVFSDMEISSVLLILTYVAHTKPAWVNAAATPANPGATPATPLAMAAAIA